MAKNTGKTASTVAETPTVSLHAADLRAVLPVFGALAGGKTPYIAVDIGSGGWQMRATDGSTWLTAHGELAQEMGLSDAGVSVCISPAKLREIVDRTKSDTIELFAEESGKIVILAGSSHYTLQTVDPSVFPAPPSHEHVISTTVPGVALADAIARTQYACDTESVRYALGGLHLQMTGGVLRVEATDTRRAARYAIAGVSGPDPDLAVVLPQAAARLAARILGGGDALVEMSPQQIRIKSGQWSMVSPPIDGRFPDMQGLIEGLGKPAKVATSDAASLLSLCKQAAICTSEDSRGVDFVFGHDVLTCRSTAPDVGESEVSLPCITSTPDRLTVTLDAAYVVDYIKALAPAAEVIIEVRDADSAIVLRSGPSWCVVMPMSSNR
jgi:DNA polymerase-3 subunit beta